MIFLPYASSVELHPGERNAQRATQGQDNKVFIMNDALLWKIEDRRLKIAILWSPCVWTMCKTDFLQEDVLLISFLFQ